MSRAGSGRGEVVTQAMHCFYCRLYIMRRHSIRTVHTFMHGPHRFPPSISRKHGNIEPCGSADKLGGPCGRKRKAILQDPRDIDPKYPVYLECRLSKGGGRLVTLEGSMKAIPERVLDRTRTTPMALHTGPQQAPVHVTCVSAIQSHTTRRLHASWSMLRTKSTTSANSWRGVGGPWPRVYCP